MKDPEIESLVESLTTGFNKTACRAKVSRAMALIAKHQETIAGLQQLCPHREATYTEHGDTGNFCRGDDRFWKNYHCPTCDKRWTVDVPKGW